MKRVFGFLFFLLALAFLPVAFAQAASDPTPLPNFDFKAWGSSAALFVFFVAAAVALVKGRFPKLASWGVLLISFVLAEVGAFLLFQGGLLTDPVYLQYAPPWVWLAFGLGAFVTASGGWAALIQVARARAIAKQQSTQQLAPVVGNHLILPAGTPGTEPLIHNGVQIGGVLPLTVSQAKVTVTPNR